MYSIATAVGRRVVVGALVCVALSACAGGTEADAPTEDDGAVIIQPGAPGEPNKVLTEEEAAALPTVTYNDADVAFMQGMIDHHAQALVMTALAQENSGRDQVPVLARRMEIGQTAETELMIAWLEARGEDVPDPGEGHIHLEEGDERLQPGMLVAEQFAELQAARGEDFDRLFLEYMIQHHLGALTMVDSLVAADGAQEAESGTLAQDIYADQEIEIIQMQKLLGEM